MEVSKFISELKYFVEEFKKEAKENGKVTTDIRISFSKHSATLSVEIESFDTEEILCCKQDLEFDIKKNKIIPLFFSIE